MIKLLNILNEGWYSESDTNGLLKKLHFAESEVEFEKLKKQLMKSTGWDEDDFEYTFRKFRKSIGFPDKYLDDLYIPDMIGLYVSANDKYYNWNSKNSPGLSIKPVWNKQKYKQWLKSNNTSGETSMEDSADFAQNAKYEPGLIDFVKNMISRDGGDETPLERIQWDIENYW